MEFKPLFENFHPHDEVEILDNNHSESWMKIQSIKTLEKKYISYQGLSCPQSSLQNGRRILVQYGKVTRFDIEDSKRSLSKGAKKISAIKHPTPTISNLTLSIMRWSMGDEMCHFQLKKYLDRANTNHTDISYEANDGKTLVSLKPGWGHLRAEARLSDDAYINEMGIHLTHKFPETIINAAVGRQVDNLIDHPAFKMAGEIKGIKTKDIGTFISLIQQQIPIKETLANFTQDAHQNQRGLLCA